jgi:hypothetical protein
VSGSRWAAREDQTTLYVANLSPRAFTFEPKRSLIAIEVPLSVLHPG